MLFVKEEFDESHPVFSKPKKVHPKSEDDMARRIKYTLGEYVHENGLTSADQDESLSCKEVSSPLLNDTLSLSHNLQPKQIEEDNINENIALEKVEETSVIVNNVIPTVATISEEKSQSNTEECENSSIEIGSRRCSLKRQCKERISLLDYNPMLTIRAKRTKGSSFMRTKSVDSVEESCVSATELSVESLGETISSTLPEEHSGISQKLEKDEIPDLNILPVPLANGSTEVPIMDSPPLLDISSPLPSIPTCNSGKKENLKRNDFVESDSTKNKGKKLEVNGKCKKQSKKKKRKNVYKSHSVDNVITEETSLCAQNVQEYDENSTHSKIGSCQIKNGILKIRLSKLTDCNSYKTSPEISNSEAAAYGCKRLSVPLEPLAPSIYSAYCASYKTKKKNHSSSNRSKRSGKKREKKSPQSDKAAKDTEISSDETKKITCDKSAINEANAILLDSTSCKTTFENESSKIDETKKESKCNSDDPVQTLETVDHPENELKNSFKISESPVSKEIEPQHCDEQCDDSDSKILCSIDISKINRIPMKILMPNSSPKNSSFESTHNNNSILQLNINDLAITKDNVTSDLQILSEKKNDSSMIKKEILTPPSFELNRIDQNCTENRSSPFFECQDDNTNDACPKLTPAYPFENEITEDVLSKDVTGRHSPQISRLYSAEGKFISDFQNENFSKQNNNLTLHSEINEVKVELPDSSLARHEHWNNFNESKWHDHTDVTYKSGNTYFKEQITYNITSHNIWQDPELKKPYSSEYYLNEAKKLKHQADQEIDRMVQAMKYLEAVLYFILTGNAMEHSYIDTDRVHTMYKETLTLIRFISSKFQKLHNSSCRNIDNKLTVLSLRCQSLLYLKMYQLRRDEVRHLHRSISSFIKSENGMLPEQLSPPHLQSFKQSVKHSQSSPSHQASPCSLTPSPAGSVASVSSQSSGYSSSELGWGSNSAPIYLKSKSQTDIFSDSITVSRNSYKMLQQQSLYLTNLHLSHDLWEHADYLSSKEHSREFFMELDEECGSLSLHSPFSALVFYVRKGTSSCIH